MAYRNYRQSIARGTHNAEVTLDTDAGSWVVGIEIDFSATPGYPGSYSYNAASDADYYGEGPELNGIEDARIEYVYDEESQEDVELDPWMVPIVADAAVDAVDKDDLMESLDDGSDDFDPPEPDYDDYYDECPRYYDGTGRY